MIERSARADPDDDAVRMQLTQPRDERRGGSGEASELATIAREKREAPTPPASLAMLAETDQNNRPPRPVAKEEYRDYPWPYPAAETQVTTSLMIDPHEPL